MNNDNTFIVNDIPFVPDPAMLRRRLRIKGEGTLWEEALALAAEAQQVARPKALYKVAYVEGRDEDTVTLDGVTFHSRVLRVNLAEVHRVFAFVATCGTEIDAWAHEIDDVLHAFWADQIKEMALRAATSALRQHLIDCYAPGDTSVMNPGSLPDWPLPQQRPLFTLLGDPQTAIGVTLKPSYLMEPNKSVSGIRFPTEESFESCLLCPRETCPGRRAAYQPELYRERYGLEQT